MLGYHHRHRRQGRSHWPLELEQSSKMSLTSKMLVHQYLLTHQHNTKSQRNDFIKLLCLSALCVRALSYMCVITNIFLYVIYTQQIQCTHVCRYTHGVTANQIQHSKPLYYRFVVLIKGARHHWQLLKIIANR